MFTAGYTLELNANILAMFSLFREESENATELVTLDTSPPETPPGAWPGGFNLGGSQNALGVHVNAVRKQIRTFDDARHADIANERLPHFQQSQIPLVPAPSMRLPRLSGEDGQTEGPALEGLIRKALEEEGLSDGGVVERLAERIARGTPSRPRGLKRFETT